MRSPVDLRTTVEAVPAICLERAVDCVTCDSTRIRTQLHHNPRRRTANFRGDPPFAKACLEEMAYAVYTVPFVGVPWSFRVDVHVTQFLQKIAPAEGHHAAVRVPSLDMCPQLANLVDIPWKIAVQHECQVAEG